MNVCFRSEYKYVYIKPALQKTSIFWWCHKLLLLQFLTMFEVDIEFIAKTDSKNEQNRSCTTHSPRTMLSILFTIWFHNYLFNHLKHLSPSNLPLLSLKHIYICSRSYVVWQTHHWYFFYAPTQTKSRNTSDYKYKSEKFLALDAAKNNPEGFCCCLIFEKQHHQVFS